MSKSNDRNMKLHNTGKGPLGAEGRMIVLLKNSKSNSRRGGYKPLQSTPKRLAREWKEQEGLCAACKLPLSLIDAHYDHDHETGEGRGFLHPLCNLIEGMLSSMTPESRASLLSWVSATSKWSDLSRGYYAHT